MLFSNLKIFNVFSVGNILIVIFLVISGDLFGNVRTFLLNIKVGNSAKIKYWHVRNHVLLGKANAFSLMLRLITLFRT